jgi:hypothetical protein
MMANEDLAKQVMQALAGGDRTRAAGLLRAAGMPAMRQALDQFKAQAENERRALKALGDSAHGAVGNVGSQGEQARTQAQSALQALRTHKHPPTVEMGEKPGSLRWVMIVLGLLALAAWLAFGGL